MKASGIIRRVDDLGRVVIPKEIRRLCGITEGDPLEIFFDPTECSVSLVPYNAMETSVMIIERTKKVISEFDDMSMETRHEALQLLGDVVGLLKEKPVNG